ncbi:MAG: hypothetical protein ABR955_12010 [Verrucomicrobiota bacterium]|jgi:hypothetical protein
MKTTIVCPNKNDPAWKKLVKELGDERYAYISFFRNNNVIPDVGRARAILGLKAAAPLMAKQTLSKSKKPKATVPKTTIQIHRAVVPKINAENVTALYGRTRHTGKVLTEV